MVNVKNDILTITIPCNGLSPLEVLSNYQSALIGMLHIADTDSTNHGANQIHESFFHTTDLLKHMQLNSEQMGKLSGNIQSL